MARSWQVREAEGPDPDLGCSPATVDKRDRRHGWRKRPDLVPSGFREPPVRFHPLGNHLAYATLRQSVEWLPLTECGETFSPLDLKLRALLHRFRSYRPSHRGKVGRRAGGGLRRRDRPPDQGIRFLEPIH